jgi:hypothetical protein
MADSTHAEVHVRHDRLTFVLRDWRQPVLAWGLAAATIGVMLLTTRSFTFVPQSFAVAAICLGSWFFSTHRTVHLTPQHVELVDTSRARPEQITRYPLEQIRSHGLIEVNGQTVLRIELPGRTLALPADRDQLALASAMLEAAREAFERRDAGSEGDVPAELRKVTRGMREGE